MKMKDLRNIVMVLALMSIVGLLSYRLGQKNQPVVGVGSGGSGSQLDLSMMWKVKEKLSEMFLEKDKIVDKNLVYGAISGMVSSLGDPYTVFLPPTENKSSNEDLAGEFGGVGISLGYKDKNLAVMTALSKTPAEKAGLKAGDLILKITDKSKNVDRETTDISLNEAVNLIRGKVGTSVTLKMFRDGGKDTFDVTLVRDNIVVPNLELEFKEKDGKTVAWVKLYKFADTLYKDWPQMVSKISAKQKELGSNFGGIVLDLRNNPGGFLQASVMVASDFIDSGVIVKQASSDGQTETYEVDPSRRQLLGEKLVVLVNGGSASAAEILAGSLKQHNRGKLVGEKTFGKGTVQQPVDFSDGSGLHVTIAKWLLPDGTNIHKVGVAPDVEVKPNADIKIDSQLDKAIEILLQK
jgi:carboxyl-terminal processing protease